jgi:hypothetical protein
MQLKRSLLVSLCSSVVALLPVAAAAQPASSVDAVVLTQLNMFILSSHIKAGTMNEMPTFRNDGKWASVEEERADIFPATAKVLRMRQKKCANVVEAKAQEDTRHIALTCSDGGRYVIVVDTATITP